MIEDGCNITNCVLCDGCIVKTKCTLKDCVVSTGHTVVSGTTSENLVLGLEADKAR